MKISSVRNIINKHLESEKSEEVKKLLNAILVEMNAEQDKEIDEHYESRMKSDAFAKAEAEKLAKRAERNARKLEADKTKLEALQKAIAERESKIAHVTESTTK